MRSKTLTIFIDSKPGKVYSFVANLKNMPKWAKTFCRSIKKVNNDWVIETVQGPIKMRIAPVNDFRVLDHYVTVPGAELFIPMRVVPNGTGSEVIFTIFQQPGMKDKQFANDIGLVKKDLATLKKVLDG